MQPRGLVLTGPLQKEETLAVPTPSREAAAVSRQLPGLALVGKACHVDLEAARLVRDIGQEPAVRRQFGILVQRRPGEKGLGLRGTVERDLQNVFLPADVPVGEEQRLAVGRDGGSAHARSNWSCFAATVRVRDPDPVGLRLPWPFGSLEGDRLAVRRPAWSAVLEFRGGQLCLDSSFQVQNPDVVGPGAFSITAVDEASAVR